jgi:hypothetical protein
VAFGGTETEDEFGPTLKRSFLEGFESRGKTMRNVISIGRVETRNVMPIGKKRRNL